MRAKAFNIILALVVASSAFVLSGCSKKTANALSEAMNNNMDIALSVDGEVYSGERDEFTWVELDQINTHESFRREFDNELKIMKFGTGSKNGPIYIDEHGNWTGNNTLKAAFANKTFAKTYWGDKSFQSRISQLAEDETGNFSDHTAESAINMYYNLMPTNVNANDSVMDSYISRKEAMAVICKADTPVIKVDASEFDDAFGYDEYNECAYQLKDCSYLQLDNGSLNAYTYNSPITYGEVIYMIVNRYYKDEYDNTTGGSVPGGVNAGDIIAKNGLDYGYSWQTYELETCMQNPDRGMPEDIYRAMVVGYNHGVVNSAAGWQDPVYGSEIIRFLIRAYSGMYSDATFPVNAEFGNQASTRVVEKVEPEVKEEVLEVDIKKEGIIEAQSLDDIFEIYKDQITMTDEEKEALKEATKGYTWEIMDKTMVVNCDYLNVRYGPSVNYDILTTVPAGTEVHVIARCVETGWYRILTDGRIYKDGIVAHQSDAYLTDK